MSTATGPIRILVCDDHPITRSGLVHVLSEQDDMIVVEEASDGVEAVDLVMKLRPDLVLLDLVMPKLGGIEAITSIKAVHPATKVLILTTFEDADVVGAIKAGATGYLLKGASQEEICQAVREVAAGTLLISPTVTQRAVRGFANNGVGPLSAREAQILKMAACGATEKAMASELHLTIHTIKFHARTIRSKLGAANTREAVATALKRGYIKLN